MSYKDKLKRQEYLKEYYKKNKLKIDKINKTYNELNKDKIKEYKKNWSNNFRKNNVEIMKLRNKEYKNNNKDKIKKLNAIWYNDEKNLIKIKAHREIKKDKRNNPSLYPQECIICGTNENIHFHHPEYDFVLNVYPLCSKHHYNIHNIAVQ